jgi:hypothetical protein
MEALSEDTERFLLAAGLFRGSREFHLAWALLDAYDAFGRAQQGRVPPVFQTPAVCAGLALELGLKARIVLDGKPPPTKGGAGHDYVRMFGMLSATAQEDVASRLRLAPDARKATPRELLDVLAQFEGTFVKFRYAHEELRAKGTITFHQGDIANVLVAVHDSIIALRPDFGPWNGVIWDGQDTSSAALTLHKMTAAYRRALGVL